jgi:predicted Zn-dependent protease
VNISLKAKTLFCFLLIMALTGCATAYNPATQKKELIFIDSMQEVQIGRGISDNIIKNEISPVKDAAKQLFVNKIGQRIVQVSDRRDIVYHFMVLDSRDLNAFALPGGYVYIYKGLLDRIGEQELAAILAHEVGHVAAKHSVKKMQSALGYNFLMALALAGFGNNDPQLAQEISGATDAVYGLLSKGYSRQDEFLADKLAVKYTQLAGYDSYGLVRALELLNKEKGPSGRVFEILSDHPRMEERIRKVKEEIQKHP